MTGYAFDQLAALIEDDHQTLLPQRHTKELLKRSPLHEAANANALAGLACGTQCRRWLLHATEMDKEGAA